MRNKEKEILTALIAEEPKNEVTEILETAKPRRRRSRGLFAIGQYPDSKPCMGAMPFSLRFPS